MKVLLAPLHTQQRFCRKCVVAYYRSQPDKFIWQHELRSMPPLGQLHAKRGFIPDYAAFLMFDQFVMDADAVEQITVRDMPVLGEWPELVALLSAEGALAAVDTETELKRSSHRRGVALRRDMREPERWANAMAFHDNLAAQAESALHHVPRRKNLRWKFDRKRMPGFPASDGHTHSLSAGPLLDVTGEPTDPHAELRDLALQTLASQLREVNATTALADTLGAAPLPWAPYGRYFKQKIVESDAQELIDAARSFFEVAFPTYRPETVREFGRIRADGRLRALREEISRAATSGDLLDRTYPQRVLEEVLRIERRAGRWRKIMGYASFALGLPASPEAGAATGIAGELVGAAIEKRMKHQSSWFYLISNGRGYS